MTGQERCQHCGKETVRSVARRHLPRASNGFVSGGWVLTVFYVGGGFPGVVRLVDMVVCCGVLLLVGWCLGWVGWGVGCV